MGWSIPIFRVAGIQLRIHVTFLLLIAWLAFGYYAQGGSVAAENLPGGKGARVRLSAPLAPATALA